MKTSNIRILPYDKKYDAEIKQIFNENFLNYAGLELKYVFLKIFLEHHGQWKILSLVISLSYIFPKYEKFQNENLQLPLFFAQWFAMIAALLVGIMFFSKYLFLGYMERYIADAMQTDFSNIQEYYIKNENNRFFIALDENDELCGFMGADSTQPKLKLTKDGQTTQYNSIFLQRLSISNKHKGKGIGQLLSQAVINFAQEKQYEAVNLGTALANVKAQELYQKMGFECYQQTLRYNLIGHYAVYFYKFI